MFDKFKSLFSSDNLLDTAYNTTLTMLEFDQRMYLAAGKCQLGPIGPFARYRSRLTPSPIIPGMSIVDSLGWPSAG